MFFYRTVGEEVNTHLWIFEPIIDFFYPLGEVVLSELWFGVSDKAHHGEGGSEVRVDGEFWFFAWI